MTVILKGGTIVDAEGKRKADLLLEGKLIKIGSVDSSAQIIDVNGKFITPGLIDCHVHFVFDGSESIVTQAQKSDVELVLNAVEAAKKTLLSGITTVRDLADRGFAMVALRDAINRGSIPGPRMMVAGHMITITGGHLNFMGRETDGVDDCIRAAREQIKGGVDLLKVAASGGVLTPGIAASRPSFRFEELKALVEEGKAHGRKTTAHAIGDDAIMNAVKAGVASIEHGMVMGSATTKQMASNGVFLVPTLKAVTMILEKGEGRVPDYVLQKAKLLSKSVGESFRRAMADGVPIAMGTDSGTPFNYHGENALELKLMVKMGMSNAEAIKAATISAARLLGLENVGLVKEGYLADLLVLDEDPLEDVEACQRSLRMVLKEGQVVRNDLS